MKFVPKGQIDNSVDSGDGLTSNRRQVIIWANADSVHWRIRMRHWAFFALLYLGTREEMEPEGDQLAHQIINTISHTKMACIFHEFIGIMLYMDIRISSTTGFGCSDISVFLFI